MEKNKIKLNFIKNLALIVFVLHSTSLINKCESAATLTAASATYDVYIGSTAQFVCAGFEMNELDVIWQYTDPASNVVIIYSLNALSSSVSSTKYSVANIQYDFQNVSTTLEVTDIDIADGTYTYECVCNAYRSSCPGAVVKDDISLTALATTTTTTTSTTTFALTTTEGLCLNGNYNTAQFVMIVISILAVGVATVLFHLSFHAFKESLMESFLMGLAVTITVFCVVIGIIFWVNPGNLGISETSSPILVATVMLGGCFILWILTIQYSVRLCIGDELELYLVILICVDAFLEGIGAAIIIAANVYCSALSGFPDTGFNYSYLEIIGAGLLFMFALVLLLIAGVVFYMKQKKNNEHVLNSFKALVSGSPLTPANFGLMAKSSQSQRPPALIQELWFPSKKVVPINEFQGEEFNRNIMPPKPKKLTPIFSKKRSEIMQQTGTSNGFPETGQTVKKIKKKSSSRVEDSSVPSAAYLGPDPSLVNAAGNGVVVHKKKSKRKSARGENFNKEEMNEFEVDLENHQNIQPTVQKNKFDTIWDADAIQPNLGTIGEENGPPKVTRTKSYLGGKVAKLDEGHISNLSQVEDAHKPITYKKNSKNVTDKNEIMDSNDNAHLVEEFNKAHLSSSSDIGGPN